MKKIIITISVLVITLSVTVSLKAEKSLSEPPVLNNVFTIDSIDGCSLNDDCKIVVKIKTKEKFSTVENIQNKIIDLGTNVSRILESNIGVDIKENFLVFNDIALNAEIPLLEDGIGVVKKVVRKKFPVSSKRKS